MVGFIESVSGFLLAFSEGVALTQRSEGWVGGAVALIALASMEIVLGIDNIVFISIVTGRLPAESQSSARRWGLVLALTMRIALLMSIFWIMRLVDPILYIHEWMPITEWSDWFGAEEQKSINEISWKDMILIGGGLFLLAKSVHEIHNQTEGHETTESGSRKAPSFASVLVQIAILDIVFSLDSVITAVGMAEDLWVMIAAVIIAVGVMLVFANSIALFVQRNPTIKMLALSFLILIGVMLIADGLGKHLSKGYVYFAMVFSLMVEFLNMRARRRSLAPGQPH